MTVLKLLLNSFLFWGAWIIIPLLMEIAPALGSVVLLIKRRSRKTEPTDALTFYPEICIIIPVYNSADTLYACIQSVHDSTYPNQNIHIYLVHNQGQDNSFAVYAQCQQDFPELRMQWMEAKQGKSRALNMALHNSEGKYIINLDSDGMLERSALLNLVTKFENHPDLNCMTGAVLTNPEQIKGYQGFFARLLRNLEFMEYAQAFLAGRSYASELNAVYTLSGAFSAFRKSAVLSSWMYNTDTICEDTHITFQMRYQQNERVEICENAIFFVDPIESVNKLYTQRQRWQRGSLEVAQMFAYKGLHPSKAFRDINVKTLLYDHTFAFPRMIWYLALICLMYMGYSGKAIVYSLGMIFVLYIFIGYFYFLSVWIFLKLEPELRRYYLHHWWCVPFLPLFNFMVFFIRVMGIINSIRTDSSWRTTDLTTERKIFVSILHKDSAGLRHLLQKLRGAVNRKQPLQANQTDSVSQPEQTEQTANPQPLYSVGWYACVGLLYVLAATFLIAVYWSRKTFGVEINEIVHTLLGPLEGTGDTMQATVLQGLVAPVLAVAFGFLLFALLDRFIGRKLQQETQHEIWRGGKHAQPVKYYKLQGYHVLHGAVAFIGSMLLLSGVLYGNAAYGMLDYYAQLGTETTIYEDYYVDPDSVAITATADTKNLIYIYVESLETTYTSFEDGGAQPVNYMPQLTKLAEENLNFGDVEGLGGFHAIANANWTLAALLATTSGVPFGLPVQDTVMATADAYMPGLVNLGDVLVSKGYVQEFLCGSDGSFAGRDKYFRQHGNYRICDIYAAREKGYVPEDYWHSWGLEDNVLFDIARKELTNLASEGKPFNFTMLTVDLHTPDGYLCEWCGDSYASVTGNVIDCNDRVITEFVRWCQAQDFYQDTVIIITGDHPRMDASLVDGVAYYDRTVYDCFLNSAVESKQDAKTRTFTTVDMFPTILAAMGFDIEGNRLGLGTNVFSEQKTLAEEHGFEWLNQEVAKSSNYYVTKFAPNLNLEDLN